MGELLPCVTSSTSVRELHRHEDSGFKRYSGVPGFKGLDPVSSDDSVLINNIRLLEISGYVHILCPSSTCMQQEV